MYYRILNTSYIFTYNNCLYCRCDECQGCRTKPANSMIAYRSYCDVCRVKVTFNEEKIKSLKKIVLIHNNCLEIKKDMQLLY